MKRNHNATLMCVLVLSMLSVSINVNANPVERTIKTVSDYPVLQLVATKNYKNDWPVIAYKQNKNCYLIAAADKDGEYNLASLGIPVQNLPPVPSIVTDKNGHIYLSYIWNDFTSGIMLHGFNSSSLYQNFVKKFVCSLSSLYMVMAVSLTELDPDTDIPVIVQRGYWGVNELTLRWMDNKKNWNCHDFHTPGLLYSIGKASLEINPKDGRKTCVITYATKIYIEGTDTVKYLSLNVIKLEGKYDKTNNKWTGDWDWKIFSLESVKLDDYSNFIQPTKSLRKIDKNDPTKFWTGYVSVDSNKKQKFNLTKVKVEADGTTKDRYSICLPKGFSLNPVRKGVDIITEAQIMVDFAFLNDETVLLVMSDAKKTYYAVWNYVSKKIKWTELPETYAFSITTSADKVFLIYSQQNHLYPKYYDIKLITFNADNNQIKGL